MVDNFMDRYFSADAAAAASVRLPSTQRTSRGVGMDDAVSRDLASGKESLVSWIYGHEARMVEAENYYRAGQDDKGDAIIDAEDAMREANRAGLIRLGMAPASRNEEANAIYEAARSISRQDYKMKRKVRRAEDGDQGPEYTIGEIHSKRADGIKKAGIEGYGFHTDASEGYFGRFSGPDPYADENGAPTRDSEDYKSMIKNCNRMFIDPELRLGGPAAPSELRQQRITGCDFVNRNAQRLYDTFGKTGSEDFVRTVVARSGKAGGMDKIMDCALGFYEYKKAQGQDVSGADAANEFFDTVTSVSGADINDADFRNAAMGIVESVKASGKTIDLSSPVARRSIALGLSVLARGYADGYNLLQMGTDSGRNVQKYLGDFVVTNYETGSIPQNNPLSQVYSFHEVLRNTVTPDGTPIPAEEPSGNPKAYQKSASTGAGRAVQGFVSALEREAAPYIMSGKSHMEALSSVRMDPEGAVQRISESVARSMGIPEATARGLTVEMLNYFRPGGTPQGAIDVEGMMLDRSLKDPAAKWWYVANVADDKRYAEDEARLKEHLTSPFVGMNERQAADRIAAVRYKAEKARRQGRDPKAVYEKELQTGVYRVPTGRYYAFNKKGGIQTGTLGENGRLPPGARYEFRYASGDFDRPFEKPEESINYNGILVRNGWYSEDRDRFMQLQREFAAYDKDTERTLRAWATKADGKQADGGVAVAGE